MESSSDECIGTTTPSMQTSIHGAISGTPSLQQLLEERTLSTQTIVTHVRFRESFYTILETTMPMFGSTCGGKSGMASAREKEDIAASKGTKPKEDTDHGAACSDPRHNKSTWRETSPKRSPSNLHTRERFALLFGVEVTLTVEDGVRSHILPAYAWTECIIFDILSPTIEDISQVVILNPMECLVFWGRHSRGEGFTYGEALAFSDVYHRETTTWIGHRVKMHCVMHTLRDARKDLRMVRDQEHDKTLEHIWHQYQENGEDGQSAPSCGRGYVCCTDRYLAQRFLRKQPEWRPGECLADARDHHSQSREQGHEGWLVQSGGDRLQGLYAHHETPERAPQGHPLGEGHPERVPQEFHDAFRSAWEDQSDTASGSKSETEVEEWDDIVAYDTKTSRYTTVADQECHRVHDHCRMNKHRCHDRCLGYSKTKRLSLPIFWDSTSDNAITYDDWRSDVDNYVREGHSAKLIRYSVLCVLEGRPCYTTKTAMDDRDGSLHSIMEVLDSVYGGATTYSALMSKLNTIQQGNGEVAKDYYEHVVQLRVKLQEFHHYMFQPGDLEYYAKNAFFNGLCPEYQAMVVHKRDDLQTSITHLLITMHECEENEAQHHRSRWAEYTKAYPPSTSRPLTGPTIQINTSGGQITITRIRCIIAGRTTTTVPTSPYMPHRWNLPWKFKPKRIIFCRTSIMIIPHRTGMT